MKKQSPRGFVIIVILGIAAVITAVVASQLTSTQKLQVSSLRQEEEVKARAIAEGCLDMMSSYVDKTVVDAGPGTDLDAVLQGPDDAFDTADDYLAFTGRVVLIPATASTLSGVPDEQRKHQWNLIDIPGSGGVCAARFDDNSDDARPDLPGAAAEAGEGTGLDVPNRDRDQSVYLTVIGLYPFFGGDTTAYEKAHARVTMRRLVQKINIVRPVQAGFWAGASVTLNNNNDVCGPGGVQADNVSMGNNTCACGPVAGNLSGGGIPSAGDTCTCPSTCTPASPSTVSPQPDPPVSVHWADTSNVLALEGWGRPNFVADTRPPTVGEGATADPIPLYHPGTATNGTSSVCSVFIENDGDTYIWDRLDTNASSTLDAIAGAALGIPADNCTNIPIVGPNAPRPCTWLTPASVVCLAGQSPCWKLMARFNSTPGQVVGLGAGALLEHTSTGADEEWDPKDNEPIPNVAGGRHFGAGANQLCGGPLSCADCTDPLGTPNADEALEWDDGPERWDIDGDTSNRDLPHPMIIFSEAPGGANIDSSNAFLNVSVIATGNVDVDTNVCCATCNCSLVADNNLNGGCVYDAPFGSGTLTGSDAERIDTLVHNGGFAVKASGAIDANGTIIGDLRGGTVDQRGCLIGAMASYDTAAGTACGSTAPCAPAHACPDGRVIGDIHSMSSILDKNNAGPIWGFLAAKQSICFKNNAGIAGSFQAGVAIDLKNNAMLVNTNVDATGTITAANAALRTFMEAPW